MAQSLVAAVAAAALAAACGAGGGGSRGSGSSDRGSGDSAVDQTTTTPPDLDPVEAANALCDASPPEEVGIVQSPELEEASGLALSRSQEDVVWAHNDSGGGPYVYAMGTNGTDRGRFVLPGVAPEDWEDMAIGPGPDGEGERVYVGDIGDNLEARAEILVHRFEEPVVTEGGLTLDEEVAGLETLRLRYPDGPHDSEILLVDPVSGEVVLVTKPFPAGVAQVYRAAWPEPTPAEPVALEPVGQLDLAALPSAQEVPAGAAEAPRLLGHLGTAGDVTTDGSVVALRTYSTVWVWARPDGTPLWEAFAGPPCEPTSAIEPQGEALALIPAGEGFFTLSEGAAQPLHESQAG